jgi:hypothetical protein
MPTREVMSFGAKRTMGCVSSNGGDVTSSGKFDIWAPFPTEPVPVAAVELSIARQGRD